MNLKCTENQVKAAISDYLSIRKIVHWRQNTGVMIKEHNKKTRFIKFIFWLYPHEDEGLRFLDIGGYLPDGKGFQAEIKATREKPTIPQYRTINFINNETNAKALWADSVDMFIEKFERICP